MTPFRKIELELREAQITGLKTALAIIESHLIPGENVVALAKAADEIRRLIAAAEDEQRGTKLM